MPGRPAVILDVAHNPHAASALAQNLDSMAYHPYTHAVMGAMADKDIAGVIKPLLNIVDYWYFCDLPIARAAKAQDLSQILESLGFEPGSDRGHQVFASPELAYEAALKTAGEDDRIMVFGSFYTVAGVMSYKNAKAH